MGNGTNQPGNLFPHYVHPTPDPNERNPFPDRQSNVVPLYVSMGTYNALQQSDTHPYWEFNYLGTDWVHPLYELPFTGGFPDDFDQAPDAFRDGEIGKIQSIIPGSGPRGVNNSPVLFGDNPTLPRDPDKFDGDIDAPLEFRYLNIPSGLAHEIFLDVYERLASFEPENHDLQRRLFDAYASRRARVARHADGAVP